MHRLLALLALATSSVASAAPAIEIGGHAGMWVRDADDALDLGWLATPRLGVWVSPFVGFEVDVGIGGGRRRDDLGRWRSIVPALGMIADPLAHQANLPVRPILTLQVGADLARVTLDDSETRDARTGVYIAAGSGLTIPLAGALTLRTDLRLLVDVGPHDVVTDDTYVHFQWTGGFSTRFVVVRDRDRDFVPDKDDACPTTSEDLDGFEDDDGCPDYDNDGDGVRDELDSCDDEREDLDGFEDYDGCPED